MNKCRSFDRALLTDIANGRQAAVAVVFTANQNQRGVKAWGRKRNHYAETDGLCLYKGFVARTCNRVRATCHTLLGCPAGGSTGSI